MKFLAVSLFLSFIVFIVSAQRPRSNGSVWQPCLPEGITFTTQEQIDNFQVNYPGCTEIEGDVTIGGSDITNLNGLNVLTSIGGNLLIGGNDSLTSLVGLENLTTIGGSLVLGFSTFGGYYGNPALTNLTGLEGLTTIGGDLQIAYNDALTNLTGLEGVTYIGGNLYIRANFALASLTGLDNIESNSIESLHISYNDILSTCEVESVCEYLANPTGNITIHNNATGCNSPSEVMEKCGCFPEGITFSTQAQIDSFEMNYPYCALIGGIKGEVIVSGNDITNLNGLSSLTYLWSDLKFLFNENLTSLTGLQNVTSINGTLHIEGNESISNLWGLDKIEPGSINELIIIDNPSLSGCNILNICEYLTSPGSTIQISNNAPGCSSQQDIEDACSSCLPEGITFTTQAQIDSFLINYETCHMIEGDLTINGADISDLSALETITYIYGTVTIGNISENANPQLTNLEGLNNLFFIGGNLKIYSNTALTSLVGLDNMGSIFGNLFIGDAFLNAGNPSLSSLSGLEGLHYLGGSLKISGNENLTSLTELYGLNVIDGPLRIKDNYNLTSLAGLDNIDPGSIYYLQITNNNLLSICEVQSVCDFLAAPNGTIDIFGNAPGCNSQEEVEDACETVSVHELISSELFSISPNPLESTAVIKYNLAHDSKVSVKIFNISGQQIQTLVNDVQSRGEQSVIFHTDWLKPGLYFCTLKTNKEIQTKKMIKL